MSDNIEEKISSLNKGDFVKLFELIPEFQMNPNFGEMEKMDEKSESTNFYIPSELVAEFLKIIYEIPLILDFDWIKWKEGVTILENPNYDFDSLDLITLSKLITSIEKNDRFTEGFLLSKLNDGTVLKILLSIEKKFS